MPDNKYVSEAGRKKTKVHYIFSAPIYPGLCIELNINRDINNKKPPVSQYFTLVVILKVCKVG